MWRCLLYVWVYYYSFVMCLFCHCSFYNYQLLIKLHVNVSFSASFPKFFLCIKICLYITMPRMLIQIFDFLIFWEECRLIIRWFWYHIIEILPRILSREVTLSSKKPYLHSCTLLISTFICERHGLCTEMWITCTAFYSLFLKVQFTLFFYHTAFMEEIELMNKKRCDSATFFCLSSPCKHCPGFEVVEGAPILITINKHKQNYKSLKNGLSVYQDWN